VKFVTYNIATGEIKGLGIAPSEESALLQIEGNDAGLDILLDTEATFTDYVSNGMVIPRPEMPMVQNGSILTVPSNTSFIVKYLNEILMEDVTADGILEFEFSEPGNYEISLTRFPYLDGKVTLEN
jgi:hypothetical protein